VAGARRCEWCGDPIPGELRSGTRYCSRRCSQRRPLPSAKVERSVKPALIDLRLREIERRVVADFRGSRA